MSVQVGPLLAAAVGDAYGAGFEYANRLLGDEEYERRNDLSQFWPHPKWGTAPEDGSFIPTQPGNYTDDTQMALAVAEALLEDDPWTPLSLADRFVGAFRRDPRPGYSSAFYEILLRTQTGEELLVNIRPTSTRNGGAMRASPCGFHPDLRTAARLARDQAAVTHNTREGKAAAIGAALLTHYFHYRRGPRVRVGAWLNKALPRCEWNVPWVGRVGGEGRMAVRAAITAIQTHDNLPDILRACIAFGGDVDTVAAIAMPAAARCIDIDPVLPDVLVEGLENSTYGRDYIRLLDEKLLARFPSPASQT